MITLPVKPIVLDLLQQGHHDEASWEQELTESERDTIGTPHLWSAKDHVIHRTFGRQNLIQVVTAIQQLQEVPPREKINDATNDELFTEYRLRPWTAIHTESERVYADLITLVEHLSEDELMDTQRFTAAFWTAGNGGQPLYVAFLAYCYEHGLEHLVQYYSDRNDLSRAIAIRERCVDRVIQVEVPAWVKGWFLYNLAGFYAQQNQLENAATRLQAAVAYNPRLQAHAKSDPDLAALHDPST